MKKGSLLLFAFIFMAALSTHAQTYETALGVKFYSGEGIGGINIRHLTAPHTALEGSLLFFSNTIGIEGLYEYQAPINGVEGLNYFVGGGAMLGFASNRHNDDHDQSVSFALRLTGGVDYKFTNAPIDISLGLDPFFYLSPLTETNVALGIGIRYVIQ